MSKPITGQLASRRRVELARDTVGRMKYLDFVLEIDDQDLVRLRYEVDHGEKVHTFDTLRKAIELYDSIEV